MFCLLLQIRSDSSLVIYMSGKSSWVCWGMQSCVVSHWQVSAQSHSTNQPAQWIQEDATYTGKIHLQIQYLKMHYICLYLSVCVHMCVPMCVYMLVFVCICVFAYISVCYGVCTEIRRKLEESG